MDGEGVGRVSMGILCAGAVHFSGAELDGRVLSSVFCDIFAQCTTGAMVFLFCYRPALVCRPITILHCLIPNSAMERGHHLLPAHRIIDRLA